MKKSSITRRTVAVAKNSLCAVALLAVAGSASAETLKFAHAYETSTPYHKWALWSAEQIKQRTSGRYDVDVFPASQLGTQAEMLESMTLGTADLGYVGPSLLGSASDYPAIQIHLAAFLWRDFDHFKKFQGSGIQKELIAGYESVSDNKLVAMTYYGSRHTTSNKEIKTPADMKALKMRVPPVPIYEIFPRAVGASPTPIAFAEVYLALQQGVVDAQENPLPTIKAKKFHEVQKYITLTGHMTDAFYTVIGGPLWEKLSAADRKIFREVYSEAAVGNSNDIRNSELELADWFRGQGIVVNEVDRAPFSAATKSSLLSDEFGWTPQQIQKILDL